MRACQLTREDVDPLQIGQKYNIMGILLAVMFVVLIDYEKYVTDLWKSLSKR